MSARVALALAICLQAVQAAPVLLATMGSRASFSFDGKPVTILVGESSHGIKLIEALPDSAVIETGGKRSTVRLGQDFYAAAPVDTSSATVGDARKVSLFSGSNGHFLANVSTSGGSIQGLVDTGATYLALSARHAERLGIKVGADAVPIYLNTAKGVDMAMKVSVPMVKLEGVTLYNIDAVVSRGDFPTMPLIGMSVLKQFSMQRDGDTMTLIKRY